MARTAKSISLRSTKAVMPHIALLRGINVGGKNKLPMAQLKEMFCDAGCTEVETYIQSGNIIYRATAAAAKRVPTFVSKRIAERFGYEVPVIVRNAHELQRVVDNNPFVKPGTNQTELHVAFLAKTPDTCRVAALDPARSPGDSFQVQGCQIYLHLSNGVARTKLTNQYFDTVLTTTSTLRNWRTVLKLLEMSRAKRLT